MRSCLAAFLLVALASDASGQTIATPSPTQHPPTLSTTCGQTAKKCYTDQRNALSTYQQRFDLRHGCPLFKQVISCIDNQLITSSCTGALEQQEIKQVRQWTVNDQSGICVTDPTIVATPTKLSLGLTEHLDVNCSFSFNGLPNMASIISLILSRANSSGQSFAELAGITVFSGDTVNLKTTEDVTAMGFVRPAGESYLHLHWELPSGHQAGMYLCSAQGMDSFGHNIVISDTTEVISREPNLDDVFDRLRGMNAYMKRLEKRVLDHENYTKSLEENLTDVNTYAKELEQKLSDNDMYARRLEKKISSLESLRQNSLSEMFEDSVLTFNDRKYYVSKDGLYDVEVSINICRVFGGRLVELDDVNEYSALKMFIEGNHTGFTEVAIGGYDKYKEGKWIFPSNKQRLPVLDWGPGYPNQGTRSNCLYMFGRYNWQMEDDPCKFDPPGVNHRYVCEIPIV